ncbi:class I SAM-dependent methyltransferase [Komagataeibacter sucrofermentans]|uniref:Methyltransferase n=1 Tax=Komagataeibacter sucrofermentans TaxID=1053551 RepID=A0A318QUR1_9PROT|nr:class I SAM-dependent methyltransferase [Komagataeibacter sucrofermentans]PYD78809.1 methyltransferase [Komagataeibacter sucrofermentans]GBQ49287.1 SAM-dependent methyltransferase [Komagataeibacter sucrofermentans DSM 15973]
MSGASWPRAVFERIHAASSDPWGVGSRPYERDKYRHTLALLAGQRFHHALELGCSIGAMTALLARQCDHLLAVDVAEAALAQARRRCAGLDGVTFCRGQLPDGFPGLPAASCDLIIISELLYFLSRADITRLATHCLRVRQPQAPILLVNWTGPTDTPCNGNEAARCFIATCLAAGMQVTHTQHHPHYRLDMLGAVAQQNTQ